MPAHLRCLVLGEEPLAVSCGELLLERGHALAGLVTLNPALAEWARGKDVPVYGRARIGELMAAGDIDVLLSITYPAILKAEHFTKARIDAVNFHDGPLPRYAGIHGSAWALLRGERTHAVVWHRLADGIDTGDILERRDVDIEERESSVSLNIKNAALALDAFKSLVEKLEHGAPPGIPQPKGTNPGGERLIFSRHDRPAALATLDWSQTAAELDRLVRACDWGPYINRFALAKLVHKTSAGERAVVVREASVSGAGGGPGTVLEADARSFVVACAQGALRVERTSLLSGVEISVEEALHYLGLKPGGQIVDPGREGRAAITREIAEAEPFFVKRLARAESPAVPFLSAAGPPGQTSVHSLPLPELRSRFADDIEAAATAAFSFAMATLCDRDELCVALVDGPVRKRFEAASALLAPTVPLFVGLDAGRGFAELVRAVRKDLDELRRRGGYLVDLVARTPVLSPSRALQTSALSCVAVLLDDGEALPPGAVLALRLSGGQASLVVDEGAVDTPRVRALVEQISAVCAQVAADPEKPLARVDLLDDETRKRQVFGWNDTAAPFSDEILIHTLFEEQVDARPDDVALEFEGETLTFAEVERRANRLAHALRARGVKPGQYVAFLLDRNFDLVTTMIGIAKSGAAYVPVDPGYPEERARFMVEDARAVAVVTSSSLPWGHGDGAPPPGIPILGVDGADVQGAPDTRPARVAASRDVSYAIYTSGSTGRPKGVVLTHRAVTNTLQWVNRTFSVGPRDKLLFVTSPSFDLSVYDVFGALGAGAVVEIASVETLREPELLVKKLTAPGITIWDSAPPALARLAPFFPARAPSSTLRLALMSGDWIPVKLPDHLREVFEGVEPVSFGGATEAAIWSNFHRIGHVDPSWRSIPYGRPIDNARYYILDRHMRPAPTGIAGDLYIGGLCLADGYLNREELTAERFLPDPFLPGERIYKTGDLARFWDDGTMEFLGRADFQVKVRGFRVELGEIEAVLRKQPGVRDVVCVARPDASGAKAVVAYVVPLHAAQPFDAPSLKAAVAAALPDFMVPSALVRLDRLPVTSNGKLDRAALPDPALVLERRALSPPRTPLEEKLVALWSDVLRAPVGVHDDFFDDMGGHSLLAVVVVSRLKKELGINVPLSRILAKPTIAALAQSLGDGERATSEPQSHLVVLNAHGTRPPLLIVSGAGGQVFIFRELAQRLGPDQPVYAFTAIGADGEDLPRESVEEIAAAYERELDARGLSGQQLVVGGYSFGAMVAYELAHRLRRRGKNVGAIVAFDAFAPGYPEKLPRMERALAHVEELRRRDALGRFNYVKDRIDNVRRRLLFKLGLGELLAPAVDGADREREDRMKQIWAILTQAQLAYMPKQNGETAPLLLFVAEHPFRWPATRMDDPTNGWRRWVKGRIDVVTVKGSHLELFRSENIERMATCITGLIDEVVDKRPARPRSLAAAPQADVGAADAI